ncbi:hypothetical protein Aduo_016271 [Ancylostoma duodenale]
MRRLASRNAPNMDCSPGCWSANDCPTEENWIRRTLGGSVPRQQEGVPLKSLKWVLMAAESLDAVRSSPRSKEEKEVVLIWFE